MRIGRKLITVALLCCLASFLSACYGLEPTPHYDAVNIGSPPAFVLKANYENGYYPFGSPWGELTVQGGTLEIVLDPTNSGKGLVQRSTIDGGTDPSLEERPDMLVYRLYPGVFFPFKPAPCQFSQDVWVSKKLLETSIQNGNQLVVGPDIFDRTPADGGKSRSAIQVVLNKDSLSYGKIFLRLYHQPAGGTLGRIQWDAPEFSPETWHNIKIHVGETGDVFLVQDGRIVSRTQYPSGNRLGTVGGHPGLYAAHSLDMGPPLKGWMLVDNFEIRCW